MSSRDKILAALAALKPAAVEVPELGGTVYVRPMTVGGVSRWQAEYAKDAVKGAALAIVDCLCDENGVAVLTAADVDLVAGWPASVGNALVDAIMVNSRLKNAEGASGN